MVIMMDNESPFERAARSLETVTGVPSTPVDVRTECEDLREQLARARARTLEFLSQVIVLYGVDKNDHVLTPVLKAFDIWDSELDTAIDALFDALFTEESSDGQ